MAYIIKFIKHKFRAVFFHMFGDIKSQKVNQNQSKSKFFQKQQKSDQISMIQNNLKEMRNQVDEFLKKGNTQLPPIIKARHYLYLSYINNQLSDSPLKDLKRSQSSRKKESHLHQIHKKQYSLIGPTQQLYSHNKKSFRNIETDVSLMKKNQFQTDKNRSRYYLRDEEKSVNFKTISFSSINPENTVKSIKMNDTFLSRQSYSRKIMYLSKIQKLQQIKQKNIKNVSSEEKIKDIKSNTRTVSPKFGLINLDKKMDKGLLQNQKKKEVQKRILLSSDYQKLNSIKEAQKRLSIYQQIDLRNYKQVNQEFNPMRSLVLPQSKDMNDSLLKANDQLSKQFRKRYKSNKVSSQILDDLEEDYKKMYSSKIEKEYLKRQIKQEKQKRQRKNKIKRKPPIKQLGVFSNTKQNKSKEQSLIDKQGWNLNQQPWQTQILDIKIY